MSKKISLDDIMQRVPVAATEDMTVAQTIEHLRTQGLDAKELHFLYLVDALDENGLLKSDSRLIGMVNFSDLLLQDDETTLKTFARYGVPSTQKGKGPEHAAWLTTKHKLSTLPIVDKDNVLLGFVSADTLIEFSEEPKQVTEETDNSDVSSTGGAVITHTPSLLDSETAGDEVRSIFCRIGAALSWIFPKPLGWALLWLATMAVVYLGQNSFMIYANNLFANAENFDNIPPFVAVMELALIAVQALLIVIPLILLSIHGGIVRGIKIYTENETRPPRNFVRYLVAPVIGLVHAIVMYWIAVVLFIWTRNFLEFSMMENFSAFAEDLWRFGGIIFPLGVFIPLLIASLITSLIAAALIGRAKKKHEKGGTIRPSRSAFAGMLAFLLIFAAVLYPSAFVWEAEQENIWDRVMAFEGEPEFGFDDEFTWDEEEWLDDEFIWDEGDWDDFDFGDIDFDDEFEYDVEDYDSSDMDEVQD